MIKLRPFMCLLGFPGGSAVKNLPAMQETRFDPWVRKICWRRKWQPTPVLLPGKSHGQRSLIGYSPWGHKESDMTERLYFHFHGVRWSLFLAGKLVVVISPLAFPPACPVWPKTRYKRFPGVSGLWLSSICGFLSRCKFSLRFIFCSSF